MFDLSNRKILLTGSVGHIGNTLAHALLDHGVDLICIVKNERKIDKINEIKKRGGQILVADFRNREEIENIFNIINYDKIDGLINNAAFSTKGSIENQSYESWGEGINGVLNIPFYIMQKAIPFLKKSGGSIINICSMYGVVSANPSNYEGFEFFSNPPNYGSGKAGLIHLTKYASVHLAQYNIRVNAISPGPFPNEKVQKNKKFIKKLSEQVPLGRIGKTKELVGPVLFLLSDASSYITGANIIVDGGWTVK